MIKPTDKQKAFMNFDELKLDSTIKLNNTIKTINVIFKKPYGKMIINLDMVAETKIVRSKPYNTPILVVEYRGYKNYEYFDFLDLEMAQKLKQAIDEKREFVVIENI